MGRGPLHIKGTHSTHALSSAFRSKPYFSAFSRFSFFCPAISRTSAGDPYQCFSRSFPNEFDMANFNESIPGRSPTSNASYTMCMYMYVMLIRTQVLVSYKIFARLFCLREVYSSATLAYEIQITNISLNSTAFDVSCSWMVRCSNTI